MGQLLDPINGLKSFDHQIIFEWSRLKGCTKTAWDAYTESHLRKTKNKKEKKLHKLPFLSPTGSHLHRASGPKIERQGQDGWGDFPTKAMGD